MITVCRVLENIIQAGVEGAPEHEDVFQINHVRILAPKANEHVYTNAGDRLFSTVSIMDTSGTVTMKMSAKAALELAGNIAKEECAALVSKGALNFPILCSVKVLVSKVLVSCTTRRFPHRSTQVLQSTSRHSSMTSQFSLK